MVGEKPKTYHETRNQVMALIALFEQLEIRPGDKVAILGTNMPNWVISFLATTFMGAIVVPLLPDFLPKEIENILAHSGAKAIVVSDLLWPKINDIATDTLLFRIGMEDFQWKVHWGTKSHLIPQQSRYENTASMRRILQVSFILPVLWEHRKESC